MNNFDDVAIVIPAFNPGPALASLCFQLRGMGFVHIVVVDDGSYPPIFADDLSFVTKVVPPRITVLHHWDNKGKGVALKTAFDYLSETPSYIQYVVTCDADGQHVASDILRIVQTMKRNPGAIVMGSRSFDKDVPLRSRIGNWITSRLFQKMTGIWLGDTQCGLRGFPSLLLPMLLKIAGERYEYEINQLKQLCLWADHPILVPIKTIYLDGNKSSHFNPLLDSWRIYRALLRRS
jgi:glycosyltransferase involved in cell wall biosynthesis